jgi:glycosyltransferase involved in cell wall biosynthesis
VVVCTYNYAHFLPDALRTLAARSLSDFELLIVDDGSSDNTAEVMAALQSDYHGLRYLRKPHSGIADTRNVGIRATQGTHIAFLDADDLWSPRYLETMLRTFAEHPQANLIFCDGFTLRSDGVHVEKGAGPPLPSFNGRIGSARDLFLFINAFCPSGMIFSKSLFERVGPFNIRFDEWGGMGKI